MIDRLLRFMSGSETPNLEGTTKDLEFSVAALLIEAGRMDGTFDASERAIIERLLAVKFGLEPDEVQSTVDAAQKRVEHSAQYYPFTREICTRLSREDKAEVIEMLWKVALSDGVIDPYEDALLRQIAGLIHVPDRDRSLARQRALDALDAAKTKN